MAMMADATIPRSPIHEALDARGAEWCAIEGIDVAARVQDADTEQASMESLGLCDLSGLQKIGLKGHDAEGWLAGQGIDVPQTVFESSLLDSGGVIVRIGSDEFFLEDGIGNSTVTSLAARMECLKGRVFRVEHQEATFLITGSRSLEVLAQTCGINFSEAVARQVIFTRVAGVSCGVFPDSVRNIPTIRIWVDPGYAVYLWETLVEICESLDGNVIGASCIYSELSP